MRSSDRRPRDRRTAIPALILAGALAVTIGVARYAAVSGARQDQLRFEGAAADVRAAIDSRLDAHIALLRGGAGLFSTMQEVRLQQFRVYVARLELERYPGFQGYGFTRLIPADRREAIRQSMEAQGQVGFRYWPETTGETHAILYLEPLDRLNRRAIGFNMASEPTRRAAMERARDAGAPAASGRVRLVQEDEADGDEQPGFLIYVPVYFAETVPPTLAERRALLRGFVYSPFRVRDLFRNVPGALSREVTFDIYDGDAVPERLLYSSAVEASDAPPWMRAVRRTEVAGRTWVLVFRPGAEFDSRYRRAIPLLLLTGGAALSVLLFFTTRRMVRGRADAERAAAAARRSEAALRAADRAKDEFLATISHELRTPLNAILGWAAMLEEGKVPEAERGRALSVIRRNAAAQARLVEDLLDLSRAAAGHLSLAPADVEMAPLIDAAVEAVRPAANEAGLTLMKELPATLGHIRGDPGRLQQVIANLLANAVKFTPAGGRVTVSAARTASRLTVSVSDTGIGLSPDFLPHAFERFRQADASSTRVHGGAGLGLAIARHLVRLHGGELHAASAGTDRGSTFTIDLPVAGPPAPASRGPDS